jgi:hypothetical protein
MPRSQNRRYLEIPAALYDTIAEQAKAESRTVAQVAADLITDGQTVHEYLIEMQTQLREIRRELRELADLNRQHVARPAQPHTTINAGEGSTKRSAPRRELTTPDALH